MNKADEIRDQLRQMRYLTEETKFIEDMIRRLDDQRNRLQLEEMSIRKLISNNENKDIVEEEELLDSLIPELDNSSDNNNYFFSGTPCRPIEEPVVQCIPLNDRTVSVKEPKALVEPIELDVSKVLLRLAFGGNQDTEEEEEEEEDNEN